MRESRLVLILVVGAILIYLTYQSMYRVDLEDVFIWIGLIFIGTIVLIWTILIDIRVYKTDKQIKSFSLTFLCLFFIAIILTVDIKIQHDFTKSTLLKVVYDGDYNRTSIDFKIDGTYIFENSAIGLSNNFYGTYKIDGNKITLDRDKIDNLDNLKNLEVREKDLNYDSGHQKKELYLFQVIDNGNIINRTNEYKVTVDRAE